ncbi:MAG TPA: Dyp-type peroxidase [Sporichthyaceae bacterium]|nr:Dyp-type peroxidase [Sporichthyaceae bacterium]
MRQPARPQDVLEPPAFAAIFLVATVRPGGEPVVTDLLADLAGLTRSVGFRVPEHRLSCVVGIGSDAWDRLYGPPRPAELHVLPVFAGAVHTAASTPGDLLFHLRARRPDLCFELAAKIMDRLRDQVEVIDEVHGFRYFDERDLLGFVDGTENPTGPAAVAAVTVGEEDPDFAGSSYVIVQRYRHDMDAWNARSVEEQEMVIGRTKLDDVEMSDAVKPANSHVALNTIEDADGTARQILRDNMPFGTIGTREFGTYFIGYTASPDVIELMLRNMFIGDPPGNYDRVLDFSTALTGALFFVPTADLLLDPPVAPAQAPAGATAEPSRGDGSLAIGSLRRSGTP